VSFKATQNDHLRGRQIAADSRDVVRTGRRQRAAR
jgi:hypothetical protein